MTSQGHKELIYFVSGLWCQTCANTVEAMATRCPGVKSCKLNYPTKILRVELEQGVDHEEVHRHIVEQSAPSGFGLKPLGKGWVQNFKSDLKSEMERRLRPVQTAVVIFLAMWSSMFAFAGYISELPTDQSFLLACLTTVFGLPALLIGVQPFARAGFRALRNGRHLTLDLFIAGGALSAAGLSLINLSRSIPVTFVDSATMILAILLVAKLLEAGLSYRLSTRILDAVKPLQFSIEVFRGGAWVERPVEQIRVGEKVRVGPGQTVPLDGTVVSDRARADRHLVTGEAEIHELDKGDEVLGGTIAHGNIVFVVRRPLGCRTVDSWAEAALVSPVREHAFSNLMRRVEERLVGVAVCGAFLVAAFRVVGSGSAAEGLEGFFVGVLIFCPCLFAAILPLSKQLATLHLRRYGVLLHRPEALFDLMVVERIYLDKTGTLEGMDTTFEPVTLEQDRIELARELLASLSVHCSHPILRGINLSGRSEFLTPTELNEVAGQGVVARFGEQGTITVGRPDFVSQLTGTSWPDRRHQFPLVALNRTPVGFLVSKAQFDEAGFRFLEELSLLKKREVEILSGDPNPAASRRFEKTSVRLKYTGNLTPEEKADRISNPSLFVGDGLNDALALSRARVSCRIGDRARDFVPVDIHILGANLPALIDTLRYSTKFGKVITQTAGLAFLYNLVAIPLAALGYFSPLGAVLAMLASFLVMLISVSRLIR